MGAALSPQRGRQTPATLAGTIMKERGNMRLFKDMDMSHMATHHLPVIRRESNQQFILLSNPPRVMQLPSHVKAKHAKSRGLHTYLRYQTKQWYLTLAFVFCILLLEIGGLTLSLAVNNSLPGQSKLFPQTFPTVSPTVVRCVHQTLYFNSTGQLQQTGLNEICK